MAGFNKFILTDLGTALLNRVIAEQKTLKFTKFEIGSGKQIDIKTSTRLIDKFHEFSVNETNVLVGGYTNIKGFFENKNLTSEKLMSEIGVYAQIDDEVLTEILFSYSTSVGDGEAIPNPATAYFSRTLSVVNRTDDVTSVTFDVTIDKNRYDFNTLAELQAATWLDVGDKINLWGSEVLGDSKKSSKIITTENTGIALNNGLFAKKHSDFIQDGGIIATGLDYRNDDNAIWGGEYGGYIQDTSITKVVGKRYIDQFDRKAYECLVPSHENTVTNYQTCNVKDNLSELQNLSGTKLDSDKLRVGQCLAGNSAETVLGDILKFNRPILSAVAIHLGQSASTGIILNSNHTNLNSGIVTFKSTYQYDSAVGCCYVVILG